jgi:photosystem II stability/assembly factor-like uncharacterized protein
MKKFILLSLLMLFSLCGFGQQFMSKGFISNGDGIFRNGAGIAINGGDTIVDIHSSGDSLIIETKGGKIFKAVSEPLVKGDTLDLIATQDFVNNAIDGAGFALGQSILFLHSEASDIVGYNQLLTIAQEDPEATNNAVVNSVSGSVVIQEFATQAMNLNVIPSGVWVFMSWFQVDAATATTTVTIRVYKRSALGVETELFNVTSPELNSTTPAEVDFESVQSNFNVDLTDRIVIKYFAQTTSGANRTVTLYYEGNARYTHIHTPLVLSLQTDFEKLSTDTLIVGNDTIVEGTIGGGSDPHITDSTLYIEEPNFGNYFDLKLSPYEDGYLDLYWQKDADAVNWFETQFYKNRFMFDYNNKPTATSNEVDQHFYFSTDPSVIQNSYFDVYALDTLNKEFKLFADYYGFYWQQDAENSYLKMNINPQSFLNSYFDAYAQDETGNNFFNLYANPNTFSWNSIANDESESSFNLDAQTSEGSLNINIKGTNILSADTNILTAPNGLNVGYSYNETGGTIRYNEVTGIYESYDGIALAWEELGSPPPDTSNIVGGSLINVNNDTISVDTSFFQFSPFVIGSIWDTIYNQNYTWGNISVSSDGQYMTAVTVGGFIYQSSDYGTNWNQVASSQNWRDVSISSTGQYQTAVFNGTGHIYSSTDYGATWTEVGPAGNFLDIAVSADGQYQTAGISGGFLYRSTDYGASWNQVASSRSWQGLCVSGTGQYQTGSPYGANLYVSNNYGASWTAKGSALGWADVNMSYSGQYQTALARDNQALYVSNDYGSTWTLESSGHTWYHVAIDSTGRYQIANTNTSTAYKSEDYGQTWTAYSVPIQDMAIDMSYDGIYILSTSNSQPIYATIGEAIGSKLVIKKPLIGLTDPIQDDQAVNKSYVDTLINNMRIYLPGDKSGDNYFDLTIDRNGDPNLEMWWLKPDDTEDLTFRVDKSGLFYSITLNTNDIYECQFNVSTGRFLIITPTGTASFAVQITGSLTDGAPTAAELDGLIGSAPGAVGEGFQISIKDNDGSGLLYKVESDGTDWHYVVMTKAL